MFENFHPLGPTSFTARGNNLSQHYYVLSESWFLIFFSTRIKITSIAENCNCFFCCGRNWYTALTTVFNVCGAVPFRDRGFAIGTIKKAAKRGFKNIGNTD
jgi:hypothetical protein